MDKQKTYTSWNVTVAATKKSQAMMLQRGSRLSCSCWWLLPDPPPLSRFAAPLKIPTPGAVTIGLMTRIS
jgi:hypothetical protein